VIRVPGTVAADAGMRHVGQRLLLLLRAVAAVVAAAAAGDDGSPLAWCKSNHLEGHSCYPSVISNQLSRCGQQTKRKRDENENEMGGANRYRKLFAQVTIVWVVVKWLGGAIIGCHR